MSQPLTAPSQLYPRTVELTESERYRLLAVERRRETLAALDDEPTPMELSTLAREVARREGLDVESEHVLERVRISLHHVHLPHMAELDVVDYDQSTNVVER